MINQSTKEVKTYWFFTTNTLPDLELLQLLNNKKHEIALHIVNNPIKELKKLEDATGKKINYYTIHGTARLLSKIIWKRWKKKVPLIPKNYPLSSFHNFPTLGLDILCYKMHPDEAVKITKKYINKNYVLQIHPIWLFQRGKINFRGPFYETLRSILEVDNDIKSISFRKKIFFKVARDETEYEKDIFPTKEFLLKIKERGADIFTFIERGWTYNFNHKPKSWTKVEDNVALLHINSYDNWWNRVSKKTRNMVRKAEKCHITLKVIEPNESFVEGVWKIYNETPIRQNRFFPAYGISLSTVKKYIFSSKNSIFIGAYFNDELVGFIKIIRGNNVAILSQILSLKKYWDKAINNALIAKAVEICSNLQIQWLIYGRMGNHPSLDQFKLNNGFEKFKLNRYYIPLTKKGKIAIKLGLHKELKDTIPQIIKYKLIPFYNLASRIKVKIFIYKKL